MGKPLYLNPTQIPIIVPPATATSDGAMSAEDKVKLDSLSPGISGTMTVTGTEAVAAGQLVEVDVAYLTANNAIRFRVWRHAGGSPTIAGSAVTACSGSGATFTIAIGNVVALVNLVTDGTVTINPGDPIGPSTSVDGAVLGGGVPYIGVSASNVAIGHTPGATVPVWRTII